MAQAQAQTQSDNADRLESRAMLVLWLLQDIQTLWDAEGFGTDPAVSEPLYRRLVAAIRQLQGEE